MSWGSAAEGANTGASGASGAGATGGSMGSSAGSGVLQSSAGASPSFGGEIMGGNGVSANAASQAAGSTPWYQGIANAVKDYNSGERMGLGGAIDSVQNGKYMQTAGYVGNKIQSAGAGAGNLTPMIQLPSSSHTQDNTMQDRYSNLYRMFNRR